jgi:hypothetical protein
MGFLDAQRELTVLTIVIPITYVVLYLVSIQLSYITITPYGSNDCVKGHVYTPV